jgi:hypothetical protein
MTMPLPAKPLALVALLALALAGCEALDALNDPPSVNLDKNLALALGMKGDEAGMARVAHADLDDAAIVENQRFFATMRRLGKPGEGAAVNQPAASDRRTGS